MTKKTTEFSDIDTNTLTGALPVHDSTATGRRWCVRACVRAGVRHVGASACPTQCPRPSVNYNTCARAPV